MTKRYVIILSYYDYSGVKAVFGPFNSEEDAVEALEEMEEDRITYDGNLEVKRLKRAYG